MDQLEQHQSQDIKQQMLDHLLHHGDVLFQWSFMTTSVSELYIIILIVASLLLERIIRLYVRV